MEKDSQQLVLLDAFRSAIHRRMFPGVTSVEDLIGKLGTVHVVRHGETQANVEKRINPAAEYIPEDRYTCSSQQSYSYPDAGKASLTEKGIQQADSTAEQLKNHLQPPARVFVSPQERAYETGRSVALALNIPEIEVCPNLREREFGPFAGIYIKDVAAMCEKRNADYPATNTPRDELIGALSDTGEVTAHWFNQTPKHPNDLSGETWPETRSRMANELVNILAKSQGETVALATHGDAARMLLAAVHGAPWRDVLAHQNDYVQQIQNGQVLTLNMDELLQKLVDQEKLLGQGEAVRSYKGRS